MTIAQAIPTEYNNYLFRSQLEARWAFFFDLADIPYIYEIDGYNLEGGKLWYRPDFWLPSHARYVEIKPAAPSDAELRKARSLSTETRKTVWIVCGDPCAVLAAHEFRYGSDRIVNLVLDPMFRAVFRGIVDFISDDYCILYFRFDKLHFHAALNPHFDETALHSPLIHIDFRGLDVEFENMLDALHDINISDIYDCMPSVTAQIPDHAIRARRHQFWRPRG